MNFWQVVTLVFTPSLYIILSCACLAQFRIIFNFLSTAAYHLQRSPLEAFAPSKQLRICCLSFSLYSLVQSVLGNCGKLAAQVEQQCSCPDMPKAALPARTHSTGRLTAMDCARASRNMRGLCVCF